MTTMETGKGLSRLVPRYTTDAGEYLERVGVFLRRRPVEHSVLLSTPQATSAKRSRVPGRTCGSAADEVSIPHGIAGRLRLATGGDAPLLRGWTDRFVAEAGATSTGHDEVEPRVDAGLLFVWEVDGAVVSMAAVSVAQGGVSRVQLVYTPAENRNRGFASACVASLTARELATPGRTCTLNTNLANPTSNTIYQTIGYRRVGDAATLRFDTPSLGRD